jgi:sporulation protein YlmC with PRC-barrel domain
MKHKTIVGMAALSFAFGVAGAMAQSATPSQRGLTSVPSTTAEAPKMPVTGQIVVQDGSTILAKDLIGQTVYAPDKSSKIGSISDLILSTDAKSVEGFVIGVGGFLGLGEKRVALKMDRLQTADGLHLTMDVKKEELANAPSFKSKQEQDAEKLAADRARSRTETPRGPQPGSTTPQPVTK